MFAEAGPLREFAREVRMGLSREDQKELPSRYFYDEVGSALFEVITLLPEYGLTRADARLMRRLAPALVEVLPRRVMIAELGSGSGVKTRWVLEALSAREPVRYYPIDISPGALARCTQELGSLAEVVPLEGGYIEGLREAVCRRSHGESLLLLFLGSTIGNFDRLGAVEFLREIRACLLPGDALLLGADLQKPLPQMLLAYNDPIGVTAAFNLNLLARINRELGGDFVLGNFEHEAIYNHVERRIEMHLRSRCRHAVCIPGAGLSVNFRAGETIWTEASHKFQAEEMFRIAADAGYACREQWLDQEWPFAESLFVAE